MTILDLVKARQQREHAAAPKATYVRMPPEDEPALWLQQLSTDQGVVPDVTGVHFGLEGVPGVIITIDQARKLGEALLAVAKHHKELGAPEPA